MRILRVGLAQINTTMGDLAGNTAKIIDIIGRARELGVDLLCFPEMAISGYPPEDLLLRNDFIEANLRALDQVVDRSRGLTTITGFVDLQDDLYNAAAVAADGRLVGVYHKHYLPNYGVFDENRYFQSGVEAPVFRIGGVGVGISISEDIWYPGGPARHEALSGADILVTITASPFHAGKREFRERMLSIRASDNAAFLCYLNPVGGQDELVFDGGSMIIDPMGNLLAHCRQFDEDLLVRDLILDQVWQARLHDPRRRKDRQENLVEGLTVTIEVPMNLPSAPRPPIPADVSGATRWLDPLAEIYDALILGARDYVQKNRFQKVLVGLSGGIDSSLVATLAVDALGPENVTGVSMPSRYSSEASVTDTVRLAKNLGIRLLSISIESAYSAMLSTLEVAFQGTTPGVAEENLQARIRGNILMALSNKFGWLVFATGNKSELATGYATLYGDMAGGFAVIKDVPKILVYQLAHYRNSSGSQPVIPIAILQKPPSAELRPEQLDTDTLPPYEVLDPILKAYIEEDKGLEEIIAMGFDETVIRRVLQMVDHNEYKRRQAPPGVKITPRAFGRDRRLPIGNRYMDQVS
ncbi:MAG TPA: NAD+ synthase [Anaerolineales bacterium]|nr:NAD+ synthase [Anaerolineales bacterium]